MDLHLWAFCFKQEDKNGFFIHFSGCLNFTHENSDVIIPGLVTNGTTKICCLGLILALFYSTMVIKNNFE